MVAAARELEPIAGQQGRERAANEARLADLHRRWPARKTAAARR
jgi:hypothetical protein